MVESVGFKFEGVRFVIWGLGLRVEGREFRV
jgi:hypothetical protein